MSDTQLGDYFQVMERQAWESYERTSRLYHVTRVSNIAKIAVGGLKAGAAVDIGGVEHPAIWIFTDKSWATNVAGSIGMGEFALFSIRKAAVKRDLIRWDNVAELCARVSFYCLKDRILPSYISFIGAYTLKTNTDAHTITA